MARPSNLSRPIIESLYSEALLLADEVRSTPTFMINGVQHTGDMRFEQFSEILEEALADS